MIPAPTFTKTLRFRLTAWYAVVLGFFLLVFTILGYVVVHRRLLNHHDGSIRNIAGRTLQILSEYDDCGHLTPQQQAHLSQEGKLLLIHEEQGKRSAFFLSPEMQANPLAPRLVQAPIQQGDYPWFETIEEEGGPWRVFSLPYQTRMGRHGLIRVVEDMGEIRPILGGLRVTFLFLLPTGLIFSTLGGYWLASRALSPVDRVTAMAREIEARNLDRRLPHPGANCEIGRLVDTLNHMMDRLERAFATMTRFTADASHELKSPLANLRSLVDVSQRGSRSREELQEDLSIVGEEVGRLSSIVDDLLLMARADSDRLPLHMETLRLDELTEIQVEAFAQSAEDAGIQLMVKVGTPGIILGDERWIHHLISNLIDNALKFTPSGGMVALAVDVEGEGVRLLVEDNGPGIPEPDMERIFDRFYRCDQARSHANAPGSGLGLAIAAWIAQAHRATISATNRPGGGAAFTVVFPYYEDRTP